MGKVTYKTCDLELEINGFAAGDSIKIIEVAMSRSVTKSNKSIINNQDKIEKANNAPIEYLKEETKDRLPNNEKDVIKLECPSCNQRTIFNVGITNKKVIVQTSINGDYVIIDKKDIPLSEKFYLGDATHDEVEEFMEFISKFKGRCELTYDKLAKENILECPSCKEALEYSDFIEKASENEFEYPCPICSGEIEIVMNKEKQLKKKCNKCEMEFMYV